MTSLHDAIEAGDADAVIEILDSDPGQIEIPNGLGNHPLHEAIRRQQQTIVRLLVDKGAAVNATGEHGYTPLHFVALEDNPELARLLLQHGADLELRDHEGYTPLQIACRTAPGVATVLIEHGAKVDLNCAIRLQDVGTVRQLLKSRKKLATVATFPDRLLEDGMFAGNREIFDLLLQYNRHPNPLELAQPKSLLFRAIEQAMSDCDTKFVRALLEHGASANVTNERGEPLTSFLQKFRTSVPRQADVKDELLRLLTEQGVQE